MEKMMAPSEGMMEEMSQEEINEAIQIIEKADGFRKSDKWGQIRKKLIEKSKSLKALGGEDDEEPMDLKKIKKIAEEKTMK